jgi:hypothetical protein
LQANTDNALCSGLDEILADRWLQDSLAYQELRIRSLPRRFLLREGSTP